jgi:deoxyribodipyrimidine photolyase-related protein
MTQPVRNLVVILGDQLDAQSSAWDGFDLASDMVWMAEVVDESTHVWSAKQRTVLFLSAMRHFAEDLKGRSIRLHYTSFEDEGNVGTLGGELARAIEHYCPQQLVMTAPGDWRVLSAIKTTARQHALELDVRDDRHFFSSVRDFAVHAKGRKQLRLEYWYRELRKKTGVLMTGPDRDQPEGGAWNYDVENRGAFDAQGPQRVPPPTRFEPDAVTQRVIDLVLSRMPNHPGSLEQFDWPVTRFQALQVLDEFVAKRLPFFGQYQDAMWTGQAWLYHSHLSAALNLKLLNPQEVVRAAETAYHRGEVPLASTEGFIRQILGWREFVRGIYWTQMPEYSGRNTLNARHRLPAFFWHGETEMVCLRESIHQTLKHGYAHHIQRLMVTGLYTMLLGVDPHDVHRWYLAVYVDAVEWVELPNTLGMSQYADGGVMASKPYAATGKYIQRMSNYCKGCRYDPGVSVGEKACPFTTLYWDFLNRHQATLVKNPRMVMQIKNLSRLDPARLQQIVQQAETHRGLVLAET